MPTSRPEHGLRELETARLSRGLGTWSWDVASDQLLWSEGLFRLLGAPGEKYSPTYDRFVSLIHTEHRPRVEALIQAALLDRKDCAYECPITLPDGAEGLIRVFCVVDRDANGVSVGMHGTVRDVSDLAFAAGTPGASTTPRRQGLTGVATWQEVEPAVAEALLLGAAQGTAVALAVVDIDEMHRVNDQFGRDVGDRVIADIGRRLGDAFRLDEPRHAFPDRVAYLGGGEFLVLCAAADPHALNEVLSAEIQAVVEMPIVLSGEIVLVTASLGIAVASHADSDAARLLAQACAAKRSAKRGPSGDKSSTLQPSAASARPAAQESGVAETTDHPLTWLPDRARLLRALRGVLDLLDVEAGGIGVVLLDIDRFKVVNASLGHVVGDQLLVAIADRLLSTTTPGSILGRLGGGEFVVVCSGITDEQQALAVAERICETMKRPIPWHSGSLVMSASAGVAFTDSASTQAESLLADAEAAMYRSKSNVPGRATVFTEALRSTSLRRLETETELRRGIEAGELRVHYQPIVNLADAQILGHEALVRWAHPRHGLLAPNEFIGIAEETGLIVALGSWVLREACREARRFQERGARWAHLTMSVNLSGGQLGQDDLVGLVADALGEAGLAPGDLQLEMTESVLMDDAAATVTVLQDLKALGVRLGIDDFGTGYSSLAYLQRFPVDVLKIDREFVNGLGLDLEASAVVAAIASLADTLGLKTVAEGVETKLQQETLLALGCTRGQGFLFARGTSAATAALALPTTALDLRNGVT